MKTLEFAIYTVFWNDCLQRFNATSLTLQNPLIDINTAVAVLNGLIRNIEEKRNNFEKYEEEAKRLSGISEYLAIHQRVRRPSVLLDPPGTPQAELMHIDAISISKRF